MDLIVFFILILGLSTFSEGDESCTNGKKIAIGCKHYSECVNGKNEVKTCGLMHDFNPDTQRCELSLPFHHVPCNNTETTVTTTISPPTESTKGTETPSSTPTGSTKVTETPTTTPPGIILLVGVEADNSCSWEGKRKVSGECASYTECVKGVEVTQNCFFMERFDPIELECRFFWNVDCSASPPTTSTTTTTSTTQNPNSTTTTTTIKPPETTTQHHGAASTAVISAALVSALGGLLLLA